jgi:hypothetical protein
VIQLANPVNSSKNLYETEPLNHFKFYT